MRFSWAAVFASLVYFVVGAVWVLAASPTWVWQLTLGWFLLVGLIGAFVPGVANQVSLARADLAMPAFLYGRAGEFGPLAVVVAVAGMTDLVDGTVARRFGRATNFGGGLDPVVDGVFMGGFVIGVGLGDVIPLWLALVVIARYLLPALAGGLLFAVGQRPELRHTLSGQVSTTLIFVLIGGLCLLRGLGQDPGNLVPAAEVVIPIATAATFVHLAWAATRRPAAVAEAG